MRAKQTVRVIKRNQQRLRTEHAPQTAQGSGARVAERELRMVVSGWIRNYRQQAENLRQARLAARHHAVWADGAFS